MKKDLPQKVVETFGKIKKEGFSLRHDGENLEENQQDELQESMDDAEEGDMVRIKDKDENANGMISSIDHEEEEVEVSLPEEGTETFDFDEVEFVSKNPAKSESKDVDKGNRDPIKLDEEDGRNPEKLDEQDREQTLREFKQSLEDNLRNVYANIDLVEELGGYFDRVMNDLVEERTWDEPNRTLGEFLDDEARFVADELWDELPEEGRQDLYAGEHEFLIHEMFADLDKELVHGNIFTLRDLIVEVVYIAFAE